VELSCLRLLAHLTVFLLIGAVWGFLASVLYERVMYDYLSFPIGIPAALTVLLPGAIGRITAVRIFGVPVPFGTFSLQVEASAAIISICVGIAILFFIWWLRKEMLRALQKN
jgi:hypothetical protein